MSAHHAVDDRSGPPPESPELTYKGAQSLLNSGAEIPVFAVVLALSIAAGLLISLLVGLLPGEPWRGNTKDLTDYLVGGQHGGFVHRDLWIFQIKGAMCRIHPWILGAVGLGLGLAIHALKKDFDELKVGLVIVVGLLVGFCLHGSLFSLKGGNVFETNTAGKSGLFLLVGLLTGLCWPKVFGLINRYYYMVKQVSLKNQVAWYLGGRLIGDKDAAGHVKNQVPALPTDIWFVAMLVLLGVGTSFIEPSILTLAQDQATRIGLPGANPYLAKVAGFFAAAQAVVKSSGFAAVVLSLLVGVIVRVLRVPWFFSDLIWTWPISFIAGFSAKNGLLELAHEKVVHITDFDSAMLSGLLWLIGFIAGYCLVSFLGTSRGDTRIRTAGKSKAAAEALGKVKLPTALGGLDDFVAECQRLTGELKAQGRRRDVKAAIKTLTALHDELQRRSRENISFRDGDKLRAARKEVAAALKGLKR